MAGAGSIHRVKKDRWKPTKEQLHMLEGLAAIRMPSDQIATLLGVSQRTYERAYKYDDNLRAAVDQGRAKSSSTVRRTLFEMATKERNFNALRFWCVSQEGFRTTERVELTGHDGAPVTTVALSPEQRDAEIKRLLAIRSAGQAEHECEDDTE